MCGFVGLDAVQEGQLIGREIWSQWDAERPREEPEGGNHTFTHYVIGSDTESDTDSASTAGNIDSSSEYDIGSDSESDMSVNWENESVHESMDNNDQLTPRGMSPVNYVHVPASPIYSPYSPTSPAYSPSMNPINVDSDSDNEEIIPATNTD